MASRTDPQIPNEQKVLRTRKQPPFMMLLPLVYAPVLPLIRISLRHNPVVRDRLFYGVLAGPTHSVILEEVLKAQRLQEQYPSWSLFPQVSLPLLAIDLPLDPITTLKLSINSLFATIPDMPSSPWRSPMALANPVGGT
nr:uncharacterized LOC100276587 [Ipomoea batatas]